MSKSITGIHHITAIASNPQANVDFYVGVLGQRMIKKTVNFDDPGTYHFYYGDEVGTPGTIMTFFPIPNAFQGTRGTGQATATAYSIPAGSVDFWVERLTANNVKFDEPFQRFDEQVITVYDPDNLLLELVAHEQPTSIAPWTGSDIPAEHAIRGFYNLTLTERSLDKTAKLLTDVLGFKLSKEEGDRYRYEIGAGGPGNMVDIIVVPNMAPGRNAAGTVHHIALRTPDDNNQLAWLEEIGGLGYGVSPVRDRQYFHSIYFHEPGGVLFEIATDPPGFGIDETVAELGTNLKLPPQYEQHRAELERVLPPITLPEGTKS